LARVFAIAAVATALLVSVSAATADSGVPFFVGFTDDLVKKEGAAAVGPASDLGAKAFRITLMWEPGQATQVPDAVRLAYCQPGVGAFFNFLLADEPVLSGWQSGAYWTDLTAKDSLPAFAAALAAVNGAGVDCDALKGGRPSPDFMPPSAPSSLSAALVAAPPSIDLSWGAATDDTGPVSYRVYRNGALVASVSSTEWTDSTIAAGATYTYSVRALDAAGNLGAATSATVAADFSPPAAPASLSAVWVGDPSRVELTWPAATDDFGVVAYEVSRDGTVLGTTPSTAFTDPAVAPSTTYSYAVVAIDQAGNRSDPVSAAVTTPDDTAAPSEPSGLTAKAAGNPRRVELSSTVKVRTGWRDRSCTQARGLERLFHHSRKSVQRPSSSSVTRKMPSSSSTTPSAGTSMDTTSARSRARQV
jgi:chitodextrinase